MVFPVVGGDGKPTGYEISNSLRFNDGDSPYAQRTPSSAGNRKTWTLSMWFKRCDGSDRMLLAATPGSDNNSTLQLILHQNGDFRFSLNSFNVFSSNELFRDVSAWYHMVFSVDSTDGTASDRVKWYVNGTRITSFAGDGFSLLSQNHDFGWNNTIAHIIGAESASSDHMNGYIAEVNNIDGQALDASYFGETNDNGVWIPKKYTGSYGTNGFFLEFKQTGTSQNSSGIGADTSGNDHHFAVSNLAATDVTTDTPTNNFCTLNPLGQGGGGSAMAEGNLKETTDDNAGCPATFAVANGKWYWEIKIEAGSNNHIGIADADFYDQLASSPNNYRITLYQPDGRVFNMGSTTQGSDSGRVFDQGDIMGIRLDLDSGTRTIKWYEDDTLIATENIGAAQVLLTPFAGKGGSSQTMNFNFGNPAFSISSGNSDANGYGNFEYAVPSGHYALCTKNLAEYG